MSRIVSRRFIVLFVVAFGAVACARNRTVPATHDEATTPTQGTSANNSGA